MPFKSGIVHYYSRTNDYELDSSGDLGGRLKYWIYLVINESFEYYTPLEPLIQLVTNFGEELGDAAKVSLPGKGAYAKTRRSVLRRMWNDQIWVELDGTKTPYLLILKRPLSKFIPNSHRFIIMRFPDAILDPSSFAEVLSSMAQEIMRGKDLFSWNQAKSRKGIANKLLKRLFAAAEAKPGLLGFTLDLKKLTTGK